MNQDSVMINNDSFNDMIYVADFFFVNCPSICPKVKQQMLRLHEKFKNEPRFQLISYTLDPKRDTIPALSSYADKIGVTSNKWHFLRADQDVVMELADEYYVPAFIDPEAPGGFDHSGKLMLIDRNRNIRGFAEGTDPESVTDFFGTIEQLLDEQFDQ
jgi:protein SCO1/2